MISLFARHPTAANLLMVLMLTVGALSLPQLERATFPEFAADSVAVTVPYPGASAADGEEAICLPIEEALEGLVDLDELRCAAREGAVTATAEMREGGDLSRFVANVRTEIDAIDSFPDLAEPPVVRERNLTDRVTSIAVTGPMGERDLKRYAEDLKTRLLRETSVRVIEIAGFAVPEIRIELDPAMLRRFELDLVEVADIVRRQSLDLPAGSVETRGQDLLVRLADKRRSPERFADLVILGGESGGEVRLGQIARITEDYDDDAVRVELDGERAAVLDIQKNDDQDTLDLKAEVDRFLERERAEAPPGVRYVVTRDSASVVQDRVDLLVDNGILGLGLVFAVMWAVFSFRFAFWVAMALPATFLAACAAMVVLGYSINMITMVALLIAIGVIMDDSIVIAENIAAKRQAGMAPADAAVAGARQVVPSVLASFATSICVFVPLAFLEGAIGKVLAAVPVVLSLVLVFSLIEAFLILPHHLKGALADDDRPSRFHRGVRRGFDQLRENALGPLIDRAVEWRYLVLGMVVFVVLGAISLVVGGQVGFRAFPDLEGDTIEARVLMPQGTPLAHTRAAVDDILAGLDELDAATAATHPEGRSLVRARLVRFGENADVSENGAHLASVVVDLVPNEERHVAVPELLRRWREAVGTVPNASVVTFKEPIIGPGGPPIEIEIEGDELATLGRAADELQAWLARFEGVSDLHHDLREGKPEIRLTLREGARALGVDGRMLADQVRAALSGDMAAELQLGRETVEVNVLLSQPGRDAVADLESFPIHLPDDRMVPLGAVADFAWDRGLAQINRVDGARVVTLTGEVDRALINVNQLLDEALAEIVPELEARHPGIAVNLEGERAEQAETGASMRRAFLLGLLAMFVLLSVLFRSYAEPVIVLLAIPTAAIGVVGGHLALGLDLSMPSVLGFAALAGIVVNDSILLVNFVKLRAAEFGDVVAAAKQASRDRFRAVVLTSLTTIAGITPMLFETSLQAQVLIPLVTSLAFGLLASTVLVLIVIPCAFAVLHDFGLATTARRPPDAAPSPLPTE
ncbi:MAG: efflux RND transporter permease subunit [Alphaproteobacteria bacterium]